MTLKWEQSCCTVREKNVTFTFLLYQVLKVIEEMVLSYRTGHIKKYYLNRVSFPIIDTAQFFGTPKILKKN